ncbi:MAG TPA: CBS domain-containing protein [Propylenella sp.]
MHVADILKRKGTAVITVRPDQSIEHLAQRLRAERVGAAIVSEDGATVDGIISERDVSHGLAVHGVAITNMTVADLMTKGVVTCSPDDTIAHVARVMTQRRIRHLPVTVGQELAGIVSVGDVVKHRLDELELEANVLRDYAVSRQ